MTMNPPSYQGPAMADFWTESKVVTRESGMVIIGHRGCGKNTPSLLQPRPSIMENTVLSFNTAAWIGVDFVEFDVQVTKDGHPIIFHDDDVIFIQDKDERVTRRISELTLEDFISIGYQRASNSQVERVLLRQSEDGSFSTWNTTYKDSLCSLEEALYHVLPNTGFNIEMKFHDNQFLPEMELRRCIKSVVKMVEGESTGRKICFSSFHPDAALILRQEQSTHPVFFLTKAGSVLYNDSRRNSIEAAIEVCLTGGLQGIVSEVKAIISNPKNARAIKEAGLSLVTFGDLNNVPEALHEQEEVGVDGVIVDHVLEIVVEATKTKTHLNSTHPSYF